MSTVAAPPPEAAAGDQGVELDLLHRQPGGLRRVHVIERLGLMTGPRLELAIVQPGDAVQRLDCGMRLERRAIDRLDSSAAARKSDMREFVQLPMNTTSMGRPTNGRPASMPM